MSSDASRTVAISSTSGVNGTTRPGGAPPQSRTAPGTYVAETYVGDIHATMGGAPVVANDGEPAGLARVALAMRPETTQPPAPGRLIGLCAWAAVIGLAGLGVAVRSAFAILGSAPAWFDACAVICGLVGFVATLGAFATARWRRVPWALLGVASLTIVITLIMVSNI